VVLSALQCEGFVRQRSISAEAFLVTFVATKATGPPVAKSGYTSGNAALCSLEIINILLVFIGINELT